MTTTVWQPGTLYQKGSIVVPSSVTLAANVRPANADFASGDSDWTKGTGWAINDDDAFVSTYSAVNTGTGDDLALVNDTKAECSPGLTVTAKCMIQSDASDPESTGAVFLRWYDSLDAEIETEVGNYVGGSDSWRQSSVTATAPSGAASVSVGCIVQKETSAAIRADAFTWNYVPPAADQELAYKAIQDDAGLSGDTEPVWPTVVGNTVVDNEVTWEAFEANRVVWEASPLFVSGADEPDWPVEGGAFVSDGTIAWKAVPFHIEDENCPNTKEVAIAASKIFAGDDDVTRFCATLNPRDWSTAQDAGFIPSGLQQRGQVGVSVLNNYRGNLCIWSPSTFQMWQVDPDPAAMALLDTIEGIGSTHYRAAQPVSNDLFFLSALGVRTVGLSAGSGNLQAGDVGMPIDVLVQAAVDGKAPLATYYPSAGQYWLTTSKTPPVPTDPPLLLLCPLLDDAYAGVAYSYTPTVANDDGLDLTFTISSGSLPDGWELDPVTGEITGTSSAGDIGDYQFTLTVSADGYESASCVHSLTVLSGEWLLTKTNTNNDKLWVSADGGSTWNGPYTRSPFTEKNGGPVGCGIGSALIWGSGGNAERLTDFDYSDGVTTVAVDQDAGAGGSINVLRVDELMFAPRSSSNTAIPYSEDDGATWSTTTVGSGKAMSAIAKLGSVWMTADRGVAPCYFYYSTDVVPTSWTQGSRCDDGSGGSAGYTIVAGTNAAVSFKNVSNFYRTTNGTTWSEITLASHGVATESQGLAVGDIFILPMTASGSTRVKRSTDGGLTWSNVTVDANSDEVNKIDYDEGRGIIIACGDTHRVWRSTDLGETWSAQSLPFTPAAGSDDVRAGFIRRKST